MTNSAKLRPLEPKEVLLAAALLAATLLTSAAWAQEVEEIVVVGSRGEGRDPLDSMVPVDVLTERDMEQVAALGGELGELLATLAPSFSFPRQSSSGSADHVRAAQLRGLSPDQVLVLVNGKRQHTAAVVNLESKIGLGATPFDFNTIPLIAIRRIEILRDGAAAQYGSDAIAGVINIVLKDAPEGGRVEATYGAHRTDFDVTGDTISDGHTVRVAADYGFAVGGDGSLRFGGEYKDRTATNRAGIGELPFFEEQTPANLALDNQRLFAPGDGDSEDLSLYYNTRFPVGAVEFYSFGRYNRRDAEGAAFFRYPDGASGVPEVYPEGYRPVTTGDVDDISVAIGVSGSGWLRSDWDLSAVVGVNEYDFGVNNSINASFGAASPLAFDLAGFEFVQTTINADVVRAFDMAAFEGPLNLAWGAELRLEDYETSAGDPESFEAGPLADTKAVGAQAGPGLSTDSTVDEDRTVYAAYIDLEADVTAALTLGAAVRFEDYDDFGNSLDGKLSGRFRVSDALALRASAGTSFRAPSLAQTAYRFSTQNFGDGGQLEVFGHIPVSDPLAIANGAVELKEEESTSFSAGFTVDLGGRLRLTMDYFRIDIDDRITLVQGTTDNVTFFSNRVDSETDGFDITATGSVSLGTGTLNWNAAYNRSDTEVQNPEVLGEEDLNTLETAPPDDKIILGGNWDVGRWQLMLRATRFGETTRDFDFGGGFPPAQTFDAEWSLDLEIGFDVTEHWNVAVGGSNILDQYADLSQFDNSFFGHLPYDILSGIGMNGAYWYASTDYRF